MGQVLSEIPGDLKEWVAEQQMFFVATAPLSLQGHVNCSPKGIDSLRILGPKKVVYQDLTGSGIETIAHIRENNRLVIMLCAFEGPPRIVRFYGRGSYCTPGSDDFEEYSRLFPERIDCRAFIVMDVTRVSTSCGFAVPLYDHVGQRDVLDKSAERKGEEGLAKYRKKKNARSIDGLPALDS